MADITEEKLRSQSLQPAEPRWQVLWTGLEVVVSEMDLLQLLAPQFRVHIPGSALIGLIGSRPQEGLVPELRGCVLPRLNSHSTS